ncbi:MAG: RsmB/NOP family class I SAM-dependent RNA methyltransferase, partial [Rhodospirillaceae bacterium]|nr:RsmB/NOP family class I SAM-dependent RNA methyltransferase [Rhodospirillaceae bacterium]
LNQPAPMDLRVNLARVTREQAQQSLNKDKVATEPTPLSPMGLRLAAHSDIARTKAFRTGLIEVQDEGSQLLSLMVGAKSGMSVLDYCAGAGGKTLALADRMGLMGGESKGRLVASDTEESRLKRMDRRLERAKLTGLIEHHVLSDGDDWHADNEARFDRVLVDAPCTGTGTWRRHPELKKRLSEERLKDLCATQGEILNKTAPLVKPGGRLVYATCSLLPEENEAQMVTFLKAHTNFEVINWHIVWEEALPKIATPEAQRGHYLRLTPARHGTDGFFIAVLARKS